MSNIVYLEFNLVSNNTNFGLHYTQDPNLLNFQVPYNVLVVVRARTHTHTHICTHTRSRRKAHEFACQRPYFVRDGRNDNVRTQFCHEICNRK